METSGPGGLESKCRANMTFYLRYPDLTTGASSPRCWPHGRPLTRRYLCPGNVLHRGPAWNISPSRESSQEWEPRTKCSGDGPNGKRPSSSPPTTILHRTLDCSDVIPDARRREDANDGQYFPAGGSNSSSLLTSSWRRSFSRGTGSNTPPSPPPVQHRYRRHCRLNLPYRRVAKGVKLPPSRPQLSWW